MESKDIANPNSNRLSKSKTVGTYNVSVIDLMANEEDKKEASSDSEGNQEEE